MLHHQNDLFGVLPSTAPKPDGLAAADAFLSAIEEQALIATIDAADLTPFRFQQWTGKRLTASFGWHYDFERGSFTPVEPIPDVLLPIRDRAAEFAGIAAGSLVQALLIRYDPGAGIGWHRDRPMFEHVVGLSLGAPATMRFRRREGERNARAFYRRETQALAPRSIYHLTGAARWAWEHSIAPIVDTRWSVTFRSLSEQGRIEAGKPVT